jgi:hypothetical protein
MHFLDDSSRASQQMAKRSDDIWLRFSESWDSSGRIGDSTELKTPFSNFASQAQVVFLTVSLLRRNGAVLLQNFDHLPQRQTGNRVSVPSHIVGSEHRIVNRLFNRFDHGLKYWGHAVIAQ